MMHNKTAYATRLTIGGPVTYRARREWDVNRKIWIFSLDCEWSGTNCWYPVVETRDKARFTAICRRERVGHLATQV